MYKNQKAREEYNNNILNVPKKIENLSFPGEKVLVRLFQFVEETTTDTGLEEINFSQYDTDGGKRIPKKDDFVYQTRGVVITSTEAADEFMKEKAKSSPLKKGDIVWLDPNRTQHFVFLPEREVPAVEFNGYLLIHPSSIEAIEKQ